MKNNCVIVDFVRTPFSAMGGPLQTSRVEYLAQYTMEDLMARNKMDTKDLEHVVFGHSHMDTAPYNLARTAWLLTRLDEDIPGYTTHNSAASGLLALQKAYYIFKTGNDRTAIVGGAESYSNAAYILRDARYRIDLQKFPMVDSIEEGELWTQPEPMDPRDLAKALAESKGYTEEQLKAVIQAECDKMDAVSWDGHITTVHWQDRKKKDIFVTEDSFDVAQVERAAYSDGAAAMLMMDGERAEELGMTPIAEVIGFAMTACEPEDSWKGAADAAELLLKKHPEIAAADVGAFELLVDSAATTLAVTEKLETLGIAPTAINQAGGCLAYGINDGANGIIGVERCILNLKKNGGQYGIVAASVSGGQGMAVLIRV